MQGLLSAQGAAAMNRLVYYVFLPALVLTSLGSSATAERIANWWFMLINCWINVLAGLALGAALATVLRLQRDLRPAYIACCGIGAHPRPHAVRRAVEPLPRPPGNSVSQAPKRRVDLPCRNLARTCAAQSFSRPRTLRSPRPCVCRTEKHTPMQARSATFR